MCPSHLSQVHPGSGWTRLLSPFTPTAWIIGAYHSSSSSMPYHFDHPLVVTFIPFNVHAIFSLYYLSLILDFPPISYFVSPCILIRLYDKSSFFCPLDAIPHPCSQNVWTLSNSFVASQTSSEFWLNLNRLLLPAQVASIQVHWNSMSSVPVTPASPYILTFVHRHSYFIL